MLTFAYLDPGSGSLIIQAIIAALIAIPFVFRQAIRNAIARIRGRDHVGEQDADRDA
jgi:hypothetical protein